MFKKVFLVTLTIILTIVAEIIVVAEGPALRSITAMATYTGNESYPGFNSAVAVSPLWLMFIPILCGGIFIIMILRAPEQ